MYKKVMEVMKWWRQEGNVWSITVLVNDHNGRKVFWEASSVEIHVAMELELWNIGIHMDCTSISPFYLCSQYIFQLRTSLQESLMHVLTFFFQGPAKT